MLKNIFGFNYNVDNGKKVTIGGVKSIKTFLPEIVSVNVSHGSIDVLGNTLKVENFSEGEITICGVISGITHNIRGAKHEKLDK